MFTIGKKCPERCGSAIDIHPCGRGGHPLFTLAFLLAMAAATAPQVFAQDTPASGAKDPEQTRLDRRKLNLATQKLDLEFKKLQDQREPETRKLNLDTRKSELELKKLQDQLGDETQKSGLELKKLQDQLEQETQKLGLELEKLRTDTHWATRLRDWATAIVLPVVLVVGGFFISKRLHDLQKAEERSEAAVNRRRSDAERAEERRRSDAERAEERRRSELEALIEDRVRAYASAFEKLSPTAIFFPKSDAPPEVSRQFGKDDCKSMGGELSSWYFGIGGLLMTKDARDAYFALMEALRCAAVADGELATPTVAEHTKDISTEKVKGYLTELATKGYPVFEKLKDQGGPSQEGSG